MSATCPGCGEESTDRVVDNPIDQALMTYRCPNPACRIGTFLYKDANWVA